MRFDTLLNDIKNTFPEINWEKRKNRENQIVELVSPLMSKDEAHNKLHELIYPGLFFTEKDAFNIVESRFFSGYRIIIYLDQLKLIRSEIKLYPAINDILGFFNKKYLPHQGSKKFRWEYNPLIKEMYINIGDEWELKNNNFYMEPVFLKNIGFSDKLINEFNKLLKKQFTRQGIRWTIFHDDLIRFFKNTNFKTLRAQGGTMKLFEPTFPDNIARHIGTFFDSRSTSSLACASKTINEAGKKYENHVESTSSVQM
ncbi:hypothetical protein [Legionella fairfieldensis]|uniref:hypothetical protein n=1 Tax=Legionella fairfieldensis TaxID=45064 RepID=UPI00048D15DC|nr:hypothetical protein [Legionella fairfieldensis]